jgi:hypothetical protein
MFLGWDRHDPGGIALACWPGENFGSPQRIETGSAGVSGTALISGLGRTSYENIIEPCRALNSRSPVDRVAERHGSLANRNHQPASQHHGRGAKAGGEAGGETTAAGATGKHGCSSPDIASLSSATDISTKAGARFSDGGDCRAWEDLQQLHGRLPNKLQIRQSTVERMLGVGWVILDNVQKRTQLQNIPGVQGVRNVFGLETLGDLVVLQQPARRGQAFRGEAAGRRTQAIRTSLVHTGGELRFGSLRIGKRDFFGRLAPLAAFARTVVATTILLTASGIESYEILANRMGCFLRVM